MRRLALDAADVEFHPGGGDVAAVELGDGEARGDGLAGEWVPLAGVEVMLTLT